MGRQLVLLPISVLLLAGPSRALELGLPWDWTEGRSSLDVVETLIFDYHDDNRDARPELGNDHYQDLRNRFNLRLSAGDASVYARFDTATFWNAENPLLADQYVLEKISASHDGRLLRLELGDFYATVGRGIALRIRKIDELGVDTTLLGAKARLRTERFELTALSGLVNPSNLDGVDEHEVPGVLDLVSGLSFSWRVTSAATLGLHAVTFLLDLDEDRGSRTEVVGLTVDVPTLLPFLRVYAELDVAGWGDLLGFGALAGYASAQASWPKLTWLLELKHYDDYYLAQDSAAASDPATKPFRIEYTRLPTLEPDDTEIGNNQDISGGHTRIDYRPNDRGTTLFASVALFLAHDLSDAGDRAIYHARTGVEQLFLGTGRFQLEGGFREEAPDYPTDNAPRLWILRSALKVPLGGSHSVDVRGFNWWGEQVGTGKEYLIGEWSLGYSFSSWLDLTWIVGYDTQQSGRRTLDEFFPVTVTIAENQEEVLPKRQIFYSGSVALKLFSERLLFRVLAGTLRGGKKCFAGSCRDIDPFAGVRFETVIRL